MKNLYQSVGKVVSYKKKSRFELSWSGRWSRVSNAHCRNLPLLQKPRAQSKRFLKKVASENEMETSEKTIMAERSGIQ